MTLDTDDFNKLFTLFGTDISDNDLYTDNTYAEKGVIISFKNSKYKKKVKLHVNTALFLKDGKNRADKLIYKLRKWISKYFDGEYNVYDFTVTKFTAVGFIDTGSRSLASRYIKVLSRIGKVKGFSPACFEGIDKGLLLSGNSNGIDFLLYDLGKNSRDSFNGIICSEVRLNKIQTIRFYADKADTSEQIRKLFDNCKGIFMDTFSHIIPTGDYYKKGEAEEIICKNVDDAKLRRRMMHLVALIPDKKSLLLAQKALNYRKVYSVMESFAEIGLSPITISKRQDIRHLKSIYSLFQKAE